MDTAGLLTKTSDLPSSVFLYITTPDKLSYDAAGRAYLALNGVEVSIREDVSDEAFMALAGPSGPSEDASAFAVLRRRSLAIAPLAIATVISLESGTVVAAMSTAAAAATLGLVMTAGAITGAVVGGQVVGQTIGGAVKANIVVDENYPGGQQQALSNASHAITAATDKAAAAGTTTAMWREMGAVTAMQSQASPESSDVKSSANTTGKGQFSCTARCTLAGIHTAIRTESGPSKDAACLLAMTTAKVQLSKMMSSPSAFNALRSTITCTTQ